MFPVNEVEEIEQRLAGVPDPVSLLAGIFAHAPVALQIYKADGHTLLTNRAFREMFGSEPPPEYDVRRDELAAKTGVLDLILRAFAGETVQTPPVWYDPRELAQVTITAGRRVYMQATFFPLRSAARAVTHVAIVFRDLTVERVAADRNAALLKVAAALSEAVSLPEVADAILGGAMGVVGAVGGAVALLDPQGVELRLYNSRGRSMPLLDQFAAVPLTAHAPLTEAIRTGRPVWLSSAAELVGRYPLIAGLGPFPEGARLALPLIVEGRPLGCLALHLERTGALDEAERDWLQALSRLCAQALERARLSDARARDAEAAAERARFVAFASAAFSASLELEPTLRSVADACVPRLGDFCLIDLEQPDGSFARIASSCRDPARAAILEELRARYPGSPGSNQPSMRAMRVRTPVLISNFSDENLGQVSLDAHHADLIRRLGPTSFLSLPLLARGAPMGALSLGYFTSGKAHGPSEIALAHELAHRAALAVDAARLYEEAQLAIRQRDDFLSIAGHELKTPLTALSLQVQSMRRMLAREGGPADLPRARHSAEVVDRQVQRLSGLVHQLLDVSRLAAGRLALELEPVDLLEVAREVAARFADEQQRSGSAIDVGQGPPAIGRWDRQRLDQVITNLLTNAVRYGQGRPVAVVVEAGPGLVRLRVRDQGIGIALQDQKRIFERFERAAPLRNYGGVGLGLWIVHELVAALGGTVSVASEPGKGATFTVELPTSGPQTG